MKWLVGKGFDCLTERSTFGYYLAEYGAPQVRVNNKRLYGVKFN